VPSLRLSYVDPSNLTGTNGNLSTFWRWRRRTAPSRYCQVWSAWEGDMGRSGIDVEYRIMPSGDGHWYWEIVADENEVLKRGVSDTADAAAEDAKAARAAITDLHAPPSDDSKLQISCIESLQLSLEQVRTATRERARETEARVKRARDLLATSASMMLRAQAVAGDLSFCPTPRVTSSDGSTADEGTLGPR
jgi:hypothetical protein